MSGRDRASVSRERIVDDMGFALNPPEDWLDAAIRSALHESTDCVPLSPLIWYRIRAKIEAIALAST